MWDLNPDTFNIFVSNEGDDISEYEIVCGHDIFEKEIDDCITQEYPSIKLSEILYNVIAENIGSDENNKMIYANDIAAKLKLMIDEIAIKIQKDWDDKNK